MRYTVKDTRIRHNGKTYGPGEVIEITEKEAAPLGHNLDPIEDATASPAEGEVGDEKINVLDMKRRKK